MSIRFSLAVFFVGFIFLAFAGINFRFRAIRNVSAWGGMVVPFALIGLVFFVAGLVLIYINFPK